MAEEQDIQEPQVEEAPPQIGGGEPQPPAKLTLSDDNRRKLDGIVSKMVANKEKDEDIQAVVNDFKQKYAIAPTATAPTVPQVPEHQMQHDPIQDIRHIQELANKPVQGYSTATGGMGGGGYVAPSDAELAQSIAYKAQLDKMATDIGTSWGVKPETVKGVLQDFPDEADEGRLKDKATLAEQNPTAYYRLKNADALRMQIAKDGPNGVHDANIFNHLQNADNYQQLTEENVPYQQQIIREHNLGPAAELQLRETQRPLINSADPGLISKLYGTADKELGLTEDEYAGLETERLFNPNKAAADLAVIRESRGIGEDGKANPIDLSTRPYTYQRGLENIKYGLAQTGRQNLAMYIAENRPEIDKQMNGLLQSYNQKMATANPAEQVQLRDQFNNEPLVQHANEVENAADQLKYSEAEDNRLYPLNFNDQATRIVRDAMQDSGFQGSDIPHVLNKVASGAFNTYKGTWDFVKNLAINIAGSDEAKAINNAESSGQKSISDLTGYYGAASSGVEQPLNVPREIISGIQAIQNDPNLSADEKQQKSINYLKDNWDQLTANPKAGQQNLTGKAMIYGAADMAGQIMGMASQSFLLGGAIGDAGKLQKLTTAFMPMYMSIQDQMYQEAVKNGEEHPLLKSNIDAAIISLASLINPDINVVKRAAGMDSPIGKMIQGVSEDTWNKVLSTNKPIVDQMTGAIKATARQMSLAQLQYGLIAPTAQYVAHKSMLNEDANLGDMIKDGVTQTAIQMAAPALLHGLWGGIKATEVNPMQKYSLVEAGLHPDENIDLIDSKIKSGQMSEAQGHEIKMLIKHASEFMLDPNLKMTDGTPMNEKQVADNLYNSIKKKALETSLKTAPEPLKPVIEEKIHEVNKDITDGFTSDADKQKAELNQLLHDNLDRIRDKMPTMEQPIKDAIKENRPEDVFKEIASQAMETKNVEGKEVSSRPLTEEIFGKPLVDKAIELSKQKSNAKETEEPAIQTKGAGDVTDDNAAMKIKPTSDKIQPTDAFRTWDLGDMEGKPEDEAAKKHIEGVVEAWDKHPAGESGGETFGDFVKRVIPAFDQSLKTDQNNTTIVTHSSVLKAFKVWDEIGRPDIENLSEDQKKQFSDAYNKEETHNGDLDTFKGTNGDIHVIRHGQTEDNAKNNFRSGNTNLTEKGINDAKTVGKELNDKTGGAVPKIISSDLPRAIHTSNIITDALQESSAGSVLQHPQEGVGSEGGQRSGVEPGQQGKTLPEEGTPTPPSGGQVPPENVNELPFGNLPVGIAHELRVDRSRTEFGVTKPERGEGVTLEESIKHGDDLLKSGADTEKMAADFAKDKRVSYDDMSLARAKYNQLVRNTDNAVEEKGENSDEAKAAAKQENDWYDKVVKPMQTEWSKIGVAQQGTVDLDTGSITSFKRAWSKQNEKPMTETQEKEAAKLVDETKQRTSDTEKVYDKIDVVHDKSTKPKEAKSIKQEAKKLADKIRENAKLNRPGMFSAATPASLAWDGGVEIVAKSIEAGGAIAEAIKNGIDYVKKSDWYKDLSESDQKQAIDQFKTWHNGEAKLGKTAEEMSVHFANKTDNKFTPEEAKNVWGYIRKRYLDKGDMSFGNALRATATDLGLNRNQILSAIATPKGAKELTTEIWKKNYEQRKAQAYARRFVETGNQPARKRLWNNLPTYFFAAKTAGHGTVGNVTHAGTNIFRPSTWSAYWPNVLKSFKLAYGKAGDYEKAVDGFIARPNFDKWVEAKLGIDPRKSYDNYQVFGLKKNWFLDTGNRGFTGLKFMRYDMAELFYNRLSDTEKADPQAREKIAELVNHATGHSDFNLNVKIGDKNYKPLNVLAFAPGLEVSRWQNVYDPIKAIGTLVNAKKSPPAELAAAKIALSGAIEKLGTYGALLAANAGFLAFIGSKQKVNISDPTKSDFLRMKGFDKTIDLTGNAVSPLRLVSGLLYQTYRSVHPDKSRTSPADKDMQTIGQQMRYKESPVAEFGSDIATGQDAMGNVMPWSSVKPGKGRYKMDWGEWSTQQLPIPLASGAKEVYDGMRERGMSVPQANDFMNGLLQAGVEMFTGAKVQHDYTLDQKGGSGGGAGAGGRTLRTSN